MRPLAVDRRPRLLELLRDGNRVEVACARMSIQVETVEACSQEFRDEVAAAERHGELLIEGTLMDAGLKGDARALERALEMRAAAKPPDLDSADAVEVARRLAFLLAAGDHQQELSRRRDNLGLGRRAPPRQERDPATVTAPPPAPVAPPTIPPGYSYEPTTARVLCPDGELAGHGLSMDRAIEVAVSDLARRTRIPPEDRTPFSPGATANKERFS